VSAIPPKEGVLPIFYGESFTYEVLSIEIESGEV